MSNFDQYYGQFSNHVPLGTNRQQEPYFEPSRTLFIGDLSYFCTEDDLCTLLSRYGQITAARVRRGVTGESLLHGFVSFQNAQLLMQAVKDLDGAVFMGRNLRVQLGTAIHQSAFDKDKFAQLHVSFISKQLNFTVTESTLREIFGRFGAIADVTIKKHSKVLRQKRQTGYGFVYFFDPDAAVVAMRTLKNATVHDITFDCSISYKSGPIKQHPGMTGGYQSQQQPTPVASHDIHYSTAVTGSFNPANFRGVDEANAMTFSRNRLESPSVPASSYSRVMPEQQFSTYSTSPFTTMTAERDKHTTYLNYPDHFAYSSFREENTNIHHSTLNNDHHIRLSTYPTSNLMNFHSTSNPDNFRSERFNQHGEHQSSTTYSSTYSSVEKDISFSTKYHSEFALSNSNLTLVPNYHDGRVDEITISTPTYYEASFRPQYQNNDTLTQATSINTLGSIPFNQQLQIDEQQPPVHHSFDPVGSRAEEFNNNIEHEK